MWLIDWRLMVENVWQFNSSICVDIFLVVDSTKEFSFNGVVAEANRFPGLLDKLEDVFNRLESFAAR